MRSHYNFDVFKLIALGAMLAVTVVFIFLRSWNIRESLWYQGDLGRDLWVLRQWSQSYKPPLLGPQTSVIPFNQSAVYFYLLYPFLILTNQSIFATWLACLVITSGLAFGCWLATYKLEPKFLLRSQFSLLAFWWFLTIHPSVITQQRLVWNPSFVPIFLSLSLGFWAARLLPTITPLHKKLLICGAGLFSSLAIAMSFSSLVILPGLLLLTLIRSRREFVNLCLSLIVCLGLLFLPYLVFELRHDWQIVARLVSQGYTAIGPSSSFLAKADRLSSFILPADANNLSRLGSWLVLMILCWQVWRVIRESVANLPRHLTLTTQVQTLTSQPLVAAACLFVITWLMFIFSPISPETHFLFPLLISFIFCLSTLPTRPLIVVALILASLWLTPNWLNFASIPTNRQVRVLEVCALQFCQIFTSPTFVSVQAEGHNYHAGYDFRFLLDRSGCNVREQESDPMSAKHMVVVADMAEYTHGQTSFAELTQFGDSREASVFGCSPDMSYHVLEKSL